MRVHNSIAEREGGTALGTKWPKRKLSGQHNSNSKPKIDSRCAKCSKNFTTPRALALHQRNCKFSEFYCDLCEKTFPSGKALGGHRARLHSETRMIIATAQKRDKNGGSNGENVIKFEKQSGKENKKNTLPSGSTRKHGEFFCEICNKEFSNGRALGGHRSNSKLNLILIQTITRKS